MKKSRNKRSGRPFSISAIAVINAVALVFTLLFWSLVYFSKLLPLPGSVQGVILRGNIAVTYGFMLGDIIYSVPLLLLATIGVWRLKDWGWTAAMMANALWVYSITVILYRDLYTKLSPGSVLFLPFALAAVWATVYLWKYRRSFWG